MKNNDVFPDMCKNLAIVPKDIGAALLIRHSDRYSISPGTYGNEISLTPEGVRNAERWGRHMGSKSTGRIFSSPVMRCIKTGKAILHGAKRSSAININPMLSSPFIENKRIAGPEFLKHGSMQIVNLLLKKIPIPGMIPLEKGVKNILDLIFDNMETTKPQITLFITHDTILAPVVCFLTGKNVVNDREWPRMLEGVFIWKNENDFFFGVAR